VLEGKREFSASSENLIGYEFIQRMLYQLSWTTLPGLRGLSCSEFRATPTTSPDTERGVVVECASNVDCDVMVAELEAHFGPQRFMNMSAAFDGVKDYVAHRATKR
jgi:hypothetical protein